MNQEEYAAYRQKLEVDLKHEAQNLRQIGYSVDTVVRSGDPVREILAAVKEKKYDLLAMATRGRKGLTRLVLGSVAESVLRDSPIPMLLVRPKSEGEGGEV
jgi:nucleotide-binding universal stress UspA family protein